jgi:monoamine oxidase
MQPDIIIIGAGAAGLMAARELSARGPAKAGRGKKVLVLEARERIGGRIFPLPVEEFGYPAEGGAEFVHGDAPITYALAREAGVAIAAPQGRWHNVSTTRQPQRAEDTEALKHALQQLDTDIPVSEFLERNFPGEHYAQFRDSIRGRIEGYDAGDASRASAFALRDALLSPVASQQGILKEGYWPLVSFLESEARARGAEIHLGKEVKAIRLDESGAEVSCADGSVYRASQVLVTVPLPLIGRIEFTPPIPEYVSAAANIGFGTVIKILLRFKDKWWEAQGEEFKDLYFLFSDEAIPTWWTQYPGESATLTGWLAGPKAAELSTHSDEELLALALASLSHIFRLSESEVREKLIASKVLNWQRDPYARGAYSYTTPETKRAVEILRTPVAGRLFFAGEALSMADGSTTVEGALESGKEVATRMLGK